jgi:hypothetical protein
VRKPILVDTETAAHYVERSVWTIYRWASEGRLTRHGKRGRNGARWDLRELEQSQPRAGQPDPPPPPKIAGGDQNFQDKGLDNDLSSPQNESGR